MTGTTTKKAVIVGINDYTLMDPSGQSNLNGCVNDAQDVANTLVIAGFEPDDITIITDRRATTENIKQGLEQTLKSATEEGDSLLFYYSGHGSQIPAIGKDKEKDSLDEILCPADLDWETKLIDDDYLNKAFSGIVKGVNLEVIFDCCHSGTATRSMIVPTRRARYLKAPLDFSFHLDYRPDLKRRGLGKQTVRRVMNHTLWAGCADFELSYEDILAGESTTRGVFTYNLCQILRKDKEITRTRLHRLLNAAMKKTGYPQTPQLESTSQNIMSKIFT